MNMLHELTTENRLERHEQELDVLSSVSALLATHSGQEEMLTQVLHELEQKLGMRQSTVMLLSADNSELYVETTRSNHTKDLRMLRYRPGEGITGNVVQTGRPAIVPRISQEPRFTNRIHQCQEGVDREVSFLCVPIVLGSKVVGTLSADLPPQPFEILQEQSRVLQIVASLIAFDVKARRMAQLERADLEVENLRLTSDSLNHGPNLPPTLPLPENSGSAPAGSLTARVEVLEKDMIVAALKSNKGNVAAAARQLGITARMVRYKIQKLDIESQSFFAKPQ